MSTLILGLSIVALLAVGALYMWRRRLVVPALGMDPRPPAMERTHYSTTYEQLGVAPPEPEPEPEEATAFMSLEELGLAEPEEGTAVVDMQALQAVPEPAQPLLSTRSGEGRGQS